jgi:hypothetical protein
MWNRNITDYAHRKLLDQVKRNMVAVLLASLVTSQGILHHKPVQAYMLPFPSYPDQSNVSAWRNIARSILIALLLARHRCHMSRDSNATLVAFSAHPCSFSDKYILPGVYL